MSLIKAFFISFVSAVLLAASGCGGVSIEPVETRTIIFKADSEINYQQLLPIDIIYVTYLHELRDLTSLGPNRWFNSDKRQNWAAKKSVSIVGGQRLVVELNSRLASRSPFIVVFATFKGVSDPAPQQVVLDSQAKQVEYISVHSHSLEAENVYLRD